MPGLDLYAALYKARVKKYGLGIFLGFVTKWQKETLLPLWLSVIAGYLRNYTSYTL